MADNNIDFQEFQNALEQMATSMGKTVLASDGLSKAERQTAQEFGAYTEKLKKAKEAQYQNTKAVTDGTLSFVKGMSSSAGSFDVLKDVVSLTSKVIGGLAGSIPLVGGAFKALGEAAGDVTKMMIDQFQTGVNAYKDLADIGLATSFEDMKNSAASTGLLFQDLSKSVGKYSGDLSNLRGGTTASMKVFNNVAKSLEGDRIKFARLGIGIEEFTEYQAKYFAQEIRQGRASSMTDAQLKKGTTDYIEQLDTLSKLTGASRKDLQSQRDAAMSESRFSAALSQVGPEVKQTFEDLNSLVLNKGGAPLAQGLRDLASGAVSTDAAQELMLKSSGAAAEIVEKIRNGSMTTAEGFNQLSAAVKKNLPIMAESAQYTGDSNKLAKDYAASQKLANAAAITPEDIAKERKTVMDGTDASVKQNTALANTTQKLYDSSKNLQLLMTSSDFVVSSMDKVAGAMDEMSIKMLEFAGVELPADLQARRDERKAIGELNEAKKKEKELSEKASATVNGKKVSMADADARLKEIENAKKSPDFEKMSVEDQDKLQQEAVAIRRSQQSGVAKQLKKAQTEVSGKQSVATAATEKRKVEVEKAGGPPAGGAVPQAKLDDILEFGGESGSKSAFEGLDQRFKDAVIAAATDYNSVTGGKITINSAKRDEEKQKQLYEKWVAGGKQGMPVAAPGTSRHERGTAVDIQNYKDQRAITAFNNQGLYQDVPNDPVHFQQRGVSARNGWDGEFKGPDTGYKPDIELHGKEQVTITPAADNTNEKLLALLETMNSKYDTMIDLLDDGNGHSKKLVDAMS